MAHRVVAMDVCHRNVGHQGQQWMLSLLQDQFWLHGMVMRMQKVISSCERCIQHEGTQVKAPLQAILVTSPLELLHVDFTGIEMTMKLDQPPHIVNVLVFCDHFTRHIMAYVTPDQMAKTVAKFLWQGYISIFGALAKLLSDWGATFEEQYHQWAVWAHGHLEGKNFVIPPQMNGQAEWVHQMLMWMIGKLGKDRKAYWSKHLLELVHAYNSTKISHHWVQHYLMFGQQLCLPIDFYFPTVVSTEKYQLSIAILLILWVTTWSLQRSTSAVLIWRLKFRGDTMIARPTPFHWNQVTWSSHKLMSNKGRRKVKDWWEEQPCEVEHRITEASLHSSWKTSRPDACESSIGIDFFSSPPQWELLYVPMYKLSRQGAPPPSWRNLLREWVRMRKHQSAKCLLLAQHQTGENPLGWVNSKLHAFLKTFYTAPLPDQGWKVWCRGKGIHGC